MKHARHCEVEFVLEPETQACDSCGRFFESIYQNEKWIRGRLQYICDRCIKRGWPWGGEDED